MKQHFQQIDVVKGLAILMVLLLHSFTRKELLQAYAAFHIWQAVPLFMVIMGLNLGLSLQRKQQPFNQLYTWDYFQKKAARIFTPFLIVFVVSIPLGLLWKWLQAEQVLQFSWYTLVGVLPITGKGNYFITLLLQSVLLLPFIGFAFRKSPILTSIIMVTLEVAFQLWAKQVSYFDDDNYLYDAAFVRYFSAIVYGLWLSRIILQQQQKASAVMLFLLACMAGLYLWFAQYGSITVTFIRPEWNIQHILTFGYAAFWVWLAIRLLPSSSDNILLRMLAELGRASYHVFLVQVVYFGLADDQSSVWLNLSICLALGYLFYRQEQNMLGMLNFKRVRSS